MANLRPVPDSPRRALGLIRVSQEREGMISPELQRTAIEDYARRRGYIITDWVEGIDESGSKAKSAWWPRLNDAIALVETKQIDAIVVWKYSRTARHRLKWAVALDRVETAGGTIESATEEIDTTTATGRFTRGMLAEMAAFEAERIGDTWKETHARRRSMGLPNNTRSRYGYVVVEGRFVPDPVTGPLLASMYRRYVNGESVWDLVQWLNSNGYRTTSGGNYGGDGTWSMQQLRRIMERGFGAGLLWFKGELLPGAQEPLIDPELWQAYLAVKKSRAMNRRGERSTYLLSGLVRCAIVLPDGSTCGSRMAGGASAPAGRFPNYRCSAGSGQRKHPGGTISQPRLERAVIEWLETEAADIDVDGELVAERAKTRLRRTRDAEAIAAEITELDRQLATATRQLLRTVITDDAYQAATGQIRTEKLVLEQQHAEALEASRAPVDTSKIAADLLADWEVLTVGERRAVLRTLIREVRVVPHRTAPQIRVRSLWD